MKRNIMVVVTVLASLLLLVGLTPVLNENNVVLANTDVSSNIIISSGQGSVLVVPDIAYINVGVTTENKDLIVAQEETKLKMDNVIKELKNHKIKEEDIRTTNYSVSPKYTWNETSNESVITGYTVTNQIKVKIKEITKLGEVLDRVVAQGGNTVSNIRFGVSNEAELYNKALEAATKDAKLKALAMGKEFNINNVRPIKITELSNRSTPNNTFKSEAIMDNSIRGATPISPGEFEITATVSIEFKY